MSQESFVGGTHSNIKLSKYELRQQQKKALQSYKQITSIKTISDKELQTSSQDAENDLQQFITSDIKTDGK